MLIVLWKKIYLSWNPNKHTACQTLIKEFLSNDKTDILEIQFDIPNKGVKSLNGFTRGIYMKPYYWAN